MTPEFYFNKMKEIIEVQTGEVKIGTADAILKSEGIGSCVVITAYDAGKKQGAMAHVMLATQADEALVTMLKGMDFVEVSLVGGANVLKRDGDTVGRDNIESITRLLKKKNIKIAAQSLGGTERRSVSLDVESGTLYCKEADENEKILWKSGENMTAESDKIDPSEDDKKKIKDMEDFQQEKLHSLNRYFFSEQLNQLNLLAYEQDELFFEGVYRDQKDGQYRVIDKIRINYRTRKNKTLFLFIVDTSGRVILHPEEERDKQLFDANISKLMMKQNEGEIEYSQGGIRTWCVFKLYKPWNWIFCMTMPVHERDKEIISFIWKALIVSLGMILLSVLIILFISKKYIHPIYNVIRKIQTIASEEIDITQQSDSSVDTRDEIGLLEQAVSKMAGNLKVYIQNEKELTAKAEASASREKQKTQELSALNQQLRAKEQALQASHKELSDKVSDLETFNRLMVGRELEMIKLKKEVNSLLKELGRESEYEEV